MSGTCDPFDGRLACPIVVLGGLCGVRWTRPVPGQGTRAWLHAPRLRPCPPGGVVRSLPAVLLGVVLVVILSICVIAWHVVSLQFSADWHY